MVGAGARGWAGAVVLLMASACAFLPGQREMDRTQQVLSTIDAVSEVHFTCKGTLLASDGLCTDVVMKDGSRLRFDRVGLSSFGSTAMNVYVASAGGLEPRIASCAGAGSPNFHRSGAIGHHFSPTLIDIKDAVFRYREVLEEVQFWPQCPQYWEVQDQRGVNYAYCARRERATEEPPRPQSCK